MIKTGRDLLGSGDSLAVEHFRQRLLGALNIKNGPGLRALDLGCGDGMEAVYLARLGYQVDALDLEPHAKWPEIEKKSKGKVRFRLGNAQSLSGIQERYDLVFEKDILHHVEDPGLVLSQMKRLLRPGGELRVVECNRYNPIFYVHLTLFGGHQHFSRRRLSRLMDAAGLEGWKLSLKEARVWPVESRVLQGAMDRVQDLVEALFFLRPFICYHLVTWKKP